MSAPRSKEEKELGLHRGRRALAACCLAGVLIWGGQELFLPSGEVQAAPLSRALPPAPSFAGPSRGRPATLRPAPPKRRPKAARIAAHRAPGSPAGAVPHPTLSAAPLLPANVEPAEIAVAGAEPIEAAAQLAARAEPEAAAEPAAAGNGEEIARAIAAQKLSAVQACFERELKQTPTLNGNLTVELDLAPPQRVNSVRVTDDLDRPAFTQCVSSTMNQLSFVALNEEVSISVPYVLHPRAK